MKKLGIVICALIFTSVSYAQVATEKKEVQVERQIKVTEENGVTTLEETTTQNGVTRHEVFTGAAADKRIAELKKIEAKEAGQIKRVKTREKIEKKEKTTSKPTPSQFMD